MSIVTELKRARTALRRSVESVAEEIGVHPNTIRYAESGRSNIAHSTLQAWARALGFMVVLAPIAQLQPAEVIEEGIADQPERPTPAQAPA